MRHLLCSVLVFGLGAAFARAQTAQLVHADGRTEPCAAAPQQDAKGRWSITEQGRRVLLQPGDVVAFVDDHGKETTMIPELSVAVDTPEVTAALASLREPKLAAWEPVAMQLGQHRSRSVFEAAVALANGQNKQLRLRAITLLARLCTKEAAMAAAAAVLAEPDAGIRRTAASTLFAVGEIVKRCDAAATIAKGLDHTDAEVRVVFAMLAKPDDPAATAVLRRDGLHHADHHVRETAAMELGERGDGAGESLLVGMLERTRVPGAEGDAEVQQRMLVREQVQVCSALGRIGTPAAKAALTKATKSRLEAVRLAATAALSAK